MYRTAKTTAKDAVDFSNADELENHMKQNAVTLAKAIKILNKAYFIKHNPYVLLFIRKGSSQKRHPLSTQTNSRNCYFLYIAIDGTAVESFRRALRRDLESD